MINFRCLYTQLSSLFSYLWSITGIASVDVVVATFALAMKIQAIIMYQAYQ